MAEFFSREKLRHAPQKEGGWKILCDLPPVWPRLVRPTNLMSKMNGKKTHTHTHTLNCTHTHTLNCTHTPTITSSILTCLELVDGPKELCTGARQTEIWIAPRLVDASRDALPGNLSFLFSLLYAPWVYVPWVYSLFYFFRTINYHIF